MTAATLNTDQLAALEAVRAGKNVSITGPGGTGKTHTIRAITEWAERSHMVFAVTALTGCAALLLNCKAKTLHSWAGVGLAKDSAEVLIESIKKNRRAARRWTDTQILIIDEVSMMPPDFFEKLDKIGRSIRKRPELPFGGLQLVLTGDFCQLPPVVKGGDTGGGPRFIFETALWRELIDVTVYLRKIVRQADPVFQRVLTEARLGLLTPESISVLETRLGLPWQENEIRPTLLFTRNAEVDEVNRRNMEALTTERRTYEVQTVVMDSGVILRRVGASSSSARGGESGSVRRLVVPPDDPDVLIALERLDADSPYEVRLELAVGAQVMLLINMDVDSGLVNGSRGIVTDFTTEGLPRVKFLSVAEPVVIDRSYWWLDDFERIGRAQIPLRVAYAVTIHKSQGATLDCALVDVGSSTFEYGQAYVALSRLRSLEGLYIWKLDPRKVRCHPTVFNYYAKLALESGEPLVGSGSSGDTTEGAAEGGAGTGAGTGGCDTDPTDAESRDLFIATALHDVNATWQAIVRPAISARLKERLAAATAKEVLAVPVLPPAAEVFSALKHCPDPSKVRAVILGQDPFPTAGHAHGLAFSVKRSVTKLPPTLTNIFKELTTDLGIPTPHTGNLEHWAEQGVLLLNDVLTVLQGARLSHAGIGWEAVTTRILSEVLRKAPHVVVIAWGANAQKKLDVSEIHNAIRDGGHTVITSAHPSPLSAHHGFFGSRPFSRTNAALVAHGLPAICWEEKEVEDDGEDVTE